MTDGETKAALARLERALDRAERAAAARGAAQATLDRRHLALRGRVQETIDRLDALIADGDGAAEGGR